MSKITKFNLNGWDFYQWAYVIKWHKDTYGKPESLSAAKAKYEEIKKEPPLTLTDLFAVPLTCELLQKFIGSDLLDQELLSIELKQEIQQ